MQHENGLLSPEVFKAAAPSCNGRFTADAKRTTCRSAGYLVVSSFDAIVEALRGTQPMCELRPHFGAVRERDLARAAVGGR